MYVQNTDSKTTVFEKSTKENPSFDKIVNELKKDDVQE